MSSARDGSTRAAGVTDVTPDGAEWLAGAGACPRSGSATVMLTCGYACDVVSAPVVFGRRMLDLLWREGPGSGPVAVFRDRMLLFTAPGTAQRLPSLLAWEEWGWAVPPLLCYGKGDAVTVPTLTGGDTPAPGGARWLVAPGTRHPWLPGPEVAVWAAVRAARAAVRISIFPPAEQGAKVYDVSRRR